MVFLVRKVEVSKWLQNSIKDGAEVSADAITNCMKTKNNAISVWEIAEETSIDDAILAIASGGDHIESIDIALLPHQTVLNAGLTLQSTPGLTPSKDLINSHRNITNLDYKSLGILKNIIVDEFKKDRVKRYTRRYLKLLIQTAIRSGRLEKELLSEDIKKSVEV